MRFSKAVTFFGRHLINCTIVKELREAVQDLRSRSPESVLADLGEQKIAALETWCRHLEPSVELEMA